mmetsp:Transcript_34117/g.39763  ORF Transcript_34117/g.39763 Transcript_34117/m.39763 type:complete len:209 (-) Transcript_34117:108-734(-)
MELLAKHIDKFVKLKEGRNLLLFRGGESLGNHSGTIIGWTDSKLTLLGRRQAHYLFGALNKYIDEFDGIYSSDLSRAIDTANIALGFTRSHKVKQDPRLREIYFGKEEGSHFDSLTETEKERFNSLDFVAKEGESWMDVRKRSRAFFASLKPGKQLIFTHGGLICANTYDLGLQDNLGNCSCAALKVDDKGVPVDILFKWELPEVKVE